MKPLNRKVIGTLAAIGTGVATYLGAAAAAKSLLAPIPAPAQAATAATASEGGAAVVGSGNLTVTGSGNVVTPGPSNTIGNVAGQGNVIQQGTFSAPSATARSAPELIFGSSANLAKRLHGVWDDHYVIPHAAGALQVDGAMNFLRNGAYNFAGDITDHTTSPSGKEIWVVWSVMDTGTWTARDGYVTMQSVSIKSQLKSLAIDGAPQDVAKMSLVMGAVGLPAPQLETRLPTGLATDFKLLSLTTSKMHVEAQPISGNRFDFVAKRRTAG